MKPSRTFRLSSSTMEQLEFLKDAYNEIQSQQANTTINVKSFSNATVLERLIEKEYTKLKGDE